MKGIMKIAAAIKDSEGKEKRGFIAALIMATLMPIAFVVFLILTVIGFIIGTKMILMITSVVLTILLGALAFFGVYCAHRFSKDDNYFRREFTSLSDIFR